jgi:probable addiction module antidote protein
MSPSKKTKSYRDWLTRKLSDPERAARYVTAAAEDSEGMFLKALRKVAEAQARPMKEIAEACGVSRESLYRMLSETGNPSSENRRAILAALGLKSVVVPIRKLRVVRGYKSKER